MRICNSASSIDAGRARTPGVLDVLLSQCIGYLEQQIPAAAVGRFFLQSRQCLYQAAVEVAMRHRRVLLRVTFEVAADVAAVFPQQRIGFILRMALEKDEECFLLLTKVSTPASAARVSTRYPQLVNSSSGSPFQRECGAGNARCSSGQAVIGRAHALEDADRAFIPLDTANAIQVKNSGVRRQARPHCGMRIVLRPFQPPW